MLTYYDGESGAELFEVSAEQAQLVPQSGPADDAIAALVDSVRFTADAATIRRALKRYGAWDAVELADDAANRRRILWIGCLDIRERPEEYPDSDKVGAA